jgi:hypothetical protein
VTVRAEVTRIQPRFDENNCTIFSHPRKTPDYPIYDQNGKLRFSADDIATHDNIIGMDWFVEGVEGDIPSFDRLTTADDPLADLPGIRR